MLHDSRSRGVWFVTPVGRLLQGDREGGFGHHLTHHET